MRLYVDIEKHCDHYKHDGEKYGSWSSSYTNNLKTVKIIKNDNSNNGEPIDFDVDVGDTVYVIWAEYSSGDSFGHSDRGSTEILQVYKSLNKAKLAHDMLEKSRKYECKIFSEVGEEVKCFIPWIGYFESLDKLHLDVRFVEI